MTDTTISDALVFPQDVGTGTPESEEDYSSAGYFSLLSKYKGEGSYVGEDTSGNPTLQFNDVDTTNEQVDVGTGYAYVMDSVSVQSGFQTVYDVALPNDSPYVVILPNEVTNLDLGTDTDNDLWLAVGPTGNDNVYIRHGSGLSAPTDPNVKLGTVNTSDGSTTRANDLSVATFDTLDSSSIIAGGIDITQFQQPAEYIVYQRSGTTHALNSETENEEFSGSDPGAVIQSAHDAISGGGDIIVKATEYVCDSFPTISTEGVRLVGEGLPWRTQTPSAFGTVLRASSNISSTDTLEFSGQFTGMDRIAVDADGNVNDAITTSSSKDIVISRYGVENASNYNIKCNTNNTWILGPSWNEFAGVAGLRIHSRVEDLWVQDTLFVTNEEHDVEIGANLFNVHINDNQFQLTDAGIRDYGGNTLHELNITDNVFTGIGRDTGNSLNTCIRIESDVKGRFTGNVADGADQDFNQQTDKFVELAGTIDATDLHIEDRGVRSMGTATVVDNANQPYHLNGVEIRNSTGATSPDQGVRLIYRRDLSPPELQAIAANGTVSTVATF